MCRTEHLDADLADLIAVVNARRPAHVPPLAMKLSWERKGSSQRQADMQHDSSGVSSPEFKTVSAHASKYVECPSCLQSIRSYFKADFQILQLQ